MSARPSVLRVGPVAVGVRARHLLIGVVLIAAIVAIALVSLSTGDTTIPLDRVVRALSGRPGGSRFIIMELRLPRVLAAVGVGAALGLAGAVFQNTARNPLASPDLLGVSAGAAVGAVTVIVQAQGSGTMVSLAAGGGALAAAIAVVALAGRPGHDNQRIVLVGIGINAALVSVVSFLLTLGAVEDVGRATVWLVGSVNGIAASDLRPLGWALAVLGPLTIALGRPLDVIELGDDLAAGLGVHVTRRRAALVASAVALVAVAVALAGPVAFVALAAPQVARFLTGATRPPLLSGALCGAAIVLAADLLARRLFAPTELPVGVITALVGAPVLLALVGGSRRRRGAIR